MSEEIEDKIYIYTRTLGAYGPLVLEYGDFFCCCLFVFFVFFVFFVYFVFFVFFVFLSFLLLLFFFIFSFFLSFFCLFVFFVFFFVFLSFCIFVFLSFLSFCHHYHNHVVNIYYHTNFCSNPTIFQFQSRSRRGHFGSSPLKDTLFWNLDNLSCHLAKSLRRLGFIQTPPLLGHWPKYGCCFLNEPSLRNSYDVT